MIEGSYGQPAMFNGEYFDSQTEAAWAAYFAAARMPYIHEPETFEVGRDKHIYTPDFLLPEQDTYVEVKNGNANWFACFKVAMLAQGIGKMVILADGKPHNMSLYLFAPGSNRTAPYNMPYPAGGYADTVFHRKDLGFVPLTETSSDSAGLMAQFAEQAKHSWTLHIDNVALRSSKERKAKLFMNRRSLAVET